MTVHFPFDNSYARLPDRFFARQNAMPVAQPRLIRLNEPLARTLGLDPDALAIPEGVEILAGNRAPDGGAPMALAYAGHQFGNFVPQLGDGRALLLGEIVGRDGIRRDIQLKGSGPTPFSRNGDGRAALGPVLREYLVSEAMTAMGVPTTRTLAAVTTGEQVRRETKLPGAVLTRVAASHIRVGTFQYFAARGDLEAIRLLADHAIDRHYPEIAGAENRYQRLLEEVIARQADLIAQWLLLGFIHGVMNTDNTAISGETIDYGPCAFMDAYDPAVVFSSIDLHSRYAYGNQPNIGQWNMARFAETLLPLLSEDENQALANAEQALNGFAPRFDAAYRGGLRRKLGLGQDRDGDDQLVYDLLSLMKDAKADFTLTFRSLADAAEPDGAHGGDTAFQSLFGEQAKAAAGWAVRWRQRLAQDPTQRPARTFLRSVNPAVIPRNHLVEAALNAAVQQQDFGPFERLLAIITQPYDDPIGFETYTLPPRPEERVLQTFCGT